MYESSTWDPLFRPRVHSTFYVRRHPCRSIQIHVCLAVLPSTNTTAAPCVLYVCCAACRVGSCCASDLAVW